MDDLLGEDWQQPAKAPPKPTPSNAPSAASAFASTYSSFRASPQLPLSGTASPQTISRPSSTVNGGAKASGSDSFGGLLNLKSQKPGSNLSMQERQKQILEEKRKQQEQNSQLWDTFGSGRGTPEVRQPSPAVPPAQEDEDDILAAFNKDAPVDRASHLEMPSTSNATSGRSTPAVATPATSSRFQHTEFNNDDDDDPFGLNDMSAKRNGHAPSPMPVPSGDDDDILGDLGKPVTDLPRRQPQPTPSNPQADEDSSSDESNTARDRPPQDRQLGELVEMGFPPDTARIALAENGGNVQNAVGWLLQQAHEESRQKARGESQQRSQGRADDQDPRSRQRDERDSMPSWMRQEARSNSASARQRNNGSPANGERDASQVAQEFGSKFLKSANTFWKASQKQVAKTLSEFQQPDSESSQPKWMREPELDTNRPSSQRREPQRRQEAQTRDAGLTDEAAMLDAPRERPQKPSRPQQTQQAPQRTQSPAQSLPQRSQEQPQYLQRPASQPDKRPATRLSRQEIEEQTAQAYVSPARRRKATPKPEVPPEPEVDLFSPEPPKPSSTPAASSAAPGTTSIPSRPRTQPTTPRPNVPPRNVPSISPSALSTSASHRKAGGEHFKRGDFAAAHESYTAALTPLPATHPIAIIVLSNRALTALKTGDAKMAVSDADLALDVIGPSLGAGESIDLGGGEGAKDMKEFYGKALMRKAEAQEHLEKYGDAAATWRQAVAAGVGGAISLRGRDRCEKAAAPKPATNPSPSPRPGGGATKSSAPASRPPPTKSLGNSLQRPTLSSASSGEAVKKLRQANAAAEKADDEKFALTDQVDAKLAAWRGGKTENLRALLQSMDAVLWESAGWKKVGMSDLVMPNKVKIVYMKAIAKVHPDKIPQDATTEQRMISAAVFSTLNEAWDKFKKDNNL